ncbi:hypothetical protein NFI96_023833 [Prochilodus magdalenae]|nr:hypothetical protein NFI96_023833 [Prochilodus magdalenae]
MALFYNIPTPTETSTLSIEAKTDGKCTKSGDALFINFTVRYDGELNSTNMVLVDIKILSGFTADPGALKDRPLVERVDTKDDHVIMYMKEVPRDRPMSYQLHLKQVLPVKNLKPAVIKVYDYYQTTLAATGRLQKEGLKAKLGKCAFFRQEVSYLGHVISSKGVSTDPAKIEAVAEWQRPGNVSELHSFLGFASYYRRFVEGFSQLAGPLHKLVATLVGVKAKKGSEQVLGTAWTPQCEQSFETLKAKLVSAPVLAYADFSNP